MINRKLTLFWGILKHITVLPNYKKMIETQAAKQVIGETVNVEVKPYKEPVVSKHPEKGVNKQLSIKRHINNWPKQ